MKNEATEVATEEAPEETLDLGTTERDGIDLSTWMFDFAVVLMLAAAIAVGLASWKTAYATPDRVLCSSCSLVGLLIGLIRSKWIGDRTWWNVRMARLSCVVGSALICMSVFLSNPIWSAVAVGVIFGGWCIGRIRGDSVFHGMFLGAVLLTPFAIDWIAALGGFQYLEMFTAKVTSLIANVAGQAYARDEASLLFEKIKEPVRFPTIGVWDSLVGLYGISLFCILAFRRSLLAATVSLFLCSIVWATVRGFTWLAISFLANANETWYPMSFELELVVFLVGVAFVFSIDQFFATVFMPIPFDQFNTETPLGSFMWNWICGLPTLKLRIPKRNKISQRWRTLLHIAGKKPSLKTDFEWLRIESFDLILHPINAIGSMIDVVRGWKDSRKWFRFFCNLPSILLLIATYLTIAFYSTKPIDRRTEMLLVKSQELCPTELLEATSKMQQEPDFCKAINAVESTEKLPEIITDDAKRLVEIQSKKFLESFPNNGEAKYRLGLIYAINNEMDRAVKEMTELATEKPIDFPQADEWVAKTLIIQNQKGPSVPVERVLKHLENAHDKKWKVEKNKDLRLLMFHAILLEKRLEYNRAIFIAKQAVAANPDLKLELAMLYGRIGREEDKMETANEAEGLFLQRTGVESETETDYILAADAMLLGDKSDDAIKILNQGLSRNPKAELIRRKVCKIQVESYRNSIKKNEDGTFELDLPLLETAADTDPTDPSISSEIAKLLPFGKKPTLKLLDVLKRQIELDKVSVQSLRLLGEGFYARGNFEAAKRYWELALAKAPDDFVVLNNLATCLIDLSSLNVDRALEMVVRANSLHPNNGDILDSWGDILVVANRPKEAIPKYELAIKVNPKRIDTRRKLIQAYEKCGMLDDVRIHSSVLENILKQESSAK